MKLEKFIELNNQITQRKENGFFNIDSDKKAITNFKEYVDKHSLKFATNIEKIEFLINNNYYENFFETYEKYEINDLIEYLYEQNFEFQSFMAISKFYESYAVKTINKDYFLENYEDRILCVSLALGNGNIQKATSMAKELINQNYQPATPTFLNAGLKNAGELISCFLLDIDDSLNSITYNISTAMQLSKIGGGVALNLTKLRASGETVRNVSGVGKGVLPVLKLLEDLFSYVDQLGKRPGAGAAYLSIFHADVLDFLDTKKINADEKSRIQNLSLGLIIPDKFMELARDNKDIHFFYPHNLYKETGKYLEDIDLNEEYENLLKNRNIKTKRYPARKLLQLIAITQFESGYPYLIFIDNANRQNPLKNISKIKMSNLCTEIFQIQTTSKIKDYYEPDEIGYDINCNLGSLNIAHLMESENFAHSIDVAIQMLTEVSDRSSLKNAPGIQKANEDFHSIGLGAMNLNGFLAKNKIQYESKEALEFVDIFFMTVNFYTLESSMEIAKKRNQTFNFFEKSEYASGEYFTKYLNTEYKINTEKIKNLFAKINVPTINMWKELKKDIQKYGLYHSYRLAIAPTQSISYIQNATASILPIVDQIETRVYGDSTTYFPMPYLNEQNHFYYKTAYNMDQLKIIDLIAKAQEHVDQGISMVLFVTNENTTNDLAKYYYYAWKKNIKSIYYVRTKNLTIEECETCSI